MWIFFKYESIFFCKYSLNIHWKFHELIFCWYYSFNIVIKLFQPPTASLWNNWSIHFVPLWCYWSLLYIRILTPFIDIPFRHFIHLQSFISVCFGILMLLIWRIDHTNFFSIILFPIEKLFLLGLVYSSNSISLYFKTFSYFTLPRYQDTITQQKVLVSLFQVSKWCFILGHIRIVWEITALTSQVHILFYFTRYVI